MSNRRSSSPVYTVEFGLQVAPAERRVLVSRFEAARHAYNAALSECHKRRRLLVESRSYTAAVAMRRGPARTKCLRKLQRRYGLTEYEMDRWSTKKLSGTWIANHLHAQARRSLATRALTAVLKHHYGVTGRPRYKGPNQLDCIAGEDPDAGIRVRGARLEWRPLSLRLLCRNGGASADQLTSEIRQIRVLRRRIRGKTRFFAQLIVAGIPPNTQLPGTQLIGIDPGLSYMAISTTTSGTIVDISDTRDRRVKIAGLSRAIQRKRKAARVGMSSGLERRPSKRQRKLQTQLADLHRRLVSERRSRHGRIANALLTLGIRLRIERNSFRAFQRRYGRTMGAAAPSSFIRHLVRKAENAGGQVVFLPASLRLSQTCHSCGLVLRKDLGTRLHECACGIGPVQRDIYSAWLAIMTKPDPKGSTWSLDADQARRAWSGAGLRLPAASRVLSVERFVDWTRAEVASGDDPSFASPSPGTERLAGAARAMHDEARNDVGARPRVRESRAGRRQMRRETARPLVTA